MMTAQELVAIADQHSVTPLYAATRRDWVGDFVPKSVATEAGTILRDEANRLQRRVEMINDKREKKALERLVGCQIELPIGYGVKNPVRPVWSDDQTEAPVKQVQQKRKQCRVLIFDKYPTTAVIRWCGKHDWNFEDTACALAGLGAAAISDITIKLQLKAGKEGERGEPAPLTKSEIKQIEELGRG